MFAFMGFLCAFKASIVGNDTVEYIRMYELAYDKLALYSSRYEPGFLMYIDGLYSLSSNPQFLFIVSSIIIYGSFSFFAWKYSKYPWMSAILFFLLLFGATNNILRQCLAMAILVCGLYFLLQKRYILALFSLAIATTLHTSAFTLALVYPLSLINLNRKTVIISIIAAIFGYLLFADILQYAFLYMPSYEMYSGGKYFEGETRLASMVQLTMAVAFSTIGYKGYNYSKTPKRPKGDDTLKLFVLMEFVSAILHMMSLKVNLIDRFAINFSAINYVLIPLAISYFPKNNKQLFNIILFILVAYSLIVIALRPEWNRIYPYEFCW